MADKKSKSPYWSHAEDALEEAISEELELDGEGEEGMGDEESPASRPTEGDASGAGSCTPPTA